MIGEVAGDQTMTYGVICISRTMGAGGEGAARLLAERLGYRYVDEEIIARAAKAAGVSFEAVEEAERSRSLIVRVMENLASLPAPELGEPFAAPQVWSPNYRHLIERVVREVASEGKAVIVAHAASIPLAGAKGVLRVLVTASPDRRAARVRTTQGLDQKAAEKAIQDSDRERARYLKRFYDIDEEAPTLYDLTVSTDSLPLDAVADVLMHAAKAQGAADAG
jgi:cytidylate kinase